MPVLLEHARLALPVMVIGIEPGAARTTSATLRQCELEAAELTSLLTTVSLSAIFSRYAPRFLSSIMRQAAPCPRANRNDGAPTPCDLLDRRLHIVGRVGSPYRSKGL